ncbi:MAG: FAD-dependent monooxygenase [Pseudopelagicola sp.]|nr:FAD-dependent monooxygenase [Pseudopelagicola sp.]
MGLQGQKITIVGAGIGGLTAAIALSQRGAKVTVLEQADAIREVGAGIQVSPNGFAVLRALGLGDAFRAIATRGTAVELRDYRAGALVARLDLELLPEDQPYFFVHRADFIALLAQAAREAGIRLRLLQRVERVTLEDGPALHMVNGDVVNAKLLIGAEGLHSKLRQTLNGVQAPFFTRQTAWRATIPNVIGHPNVSRVHMGPRQHMVSYPLRGGEIINLVAVQERTGWAEEGWMHEDDPANLRKAFAGYGGEAKAMLDAVERVGYWGLFRHPVAPVWQKGCAVILGDAAHPTLPFMAQGAVMAMEDAWVLADALARADTVESGLAAYQARREGRVRKVIAAANGNAWKYHLAFGPLRFGAHLGLRALSNVAPKRLMQQYDWIYRHDVTKG